MKEIDVRGLSCPEPVLIVMDEMDADPGQDLAVDGRGGGPGVGLGRAGRCGPYKG